MTFIVTTLIHELASIVTLPAILAISAGWISASMDGAAAGPATPRPCTAADRGTTETTAVHGQLPEPRPAFGGMAGAILQGSQPDAVIFAHDAERASCYHWDHLPLADLEAEIRMAEALGGAPVAAITTRGRDNVCRLRRLGLPVADVLDGDGAAVLPDAAEAVWSAPQGAGRAGAAR